MAGWNTTTYIQKNTVRTYQSILSKLPAHFGDGELNSLAPEEILSFLTHINQGTKQLTKHTRYAQLTAFFNFVTQNLDPNFRIYSSILQDFNVLNAGETNLFKLNLTPGTQRHGEQTVVSSVACTGFTTKSPLTLL